MAKFAAYSSTGGAAVTRAEKRGAQRPPRANSGPFRPSPSVSRRRASLGCRGRLISLPKPPTVRRIVDLKRVSSAELDALERFAAARLRHKCYYRRLRAADHGDDEHLIAVLQHILSPAVVIGSRNLMPYFWKWLLQCLRSRVRFLGFFIFSRYFHVSVSPSRSQMPTFLRLFSYSSRFSLLTASCQSHGS